MTGEDEKQGPERDLWAHAIERAGLGVWDADLQTGDCYYSPSWARMLGYAPGELPRDPDVWLALLHPDDREQAIASGDRHVAGLTERIDTEMRLRHKDGHWVWVLDRGGSVAWDAWGKPTRIVGVQTDITRRKQAEDRLAQINARLRLALDASGTGIWHHDFATRTSFWDARTHEIFGLPSGDGEVARDQWVSQLHPEDRQRAEREHTLPRKTGATAQLRYRMIRTDGEIRHLETLVRFVPEFGEEGQFVGTVQDITEACLREEELARAASHDRLTGLLNRSAFDAELARALEHVEDRPFAIYYLDLDYFKALNDVAGHATGDSALQMIGRIISQALPHDATAARLGGDEFAILAPLADGQEPSTLAQTILRAIAGTSFGENAGSPKLGASIGYALINDGSISQAEAVARADDACYAAKASGRNRCVAFGEGAAASTSGLTAARILAETIDGMEDDRLLLFGQQIHILGLPWSRSHRCEVLARLQDRNGRLIPPGAFIPAAERFGMASRLDRWIVRNALQRYGHAMRGSGDLVLGFNLSAQTLSVPGLWEFVDREVEASHAAHSNLVFEITETAAVTNFQAAERFVHAARERNCRVSLDDFGSGLSSFDYLRRFPVDSIKINGDFVENLAGSAFDQAVVRAITDIAKAIGLTVVAEKIEDGDTQALLKDLGIRYGQGFFLHRPEPLDAIMVQLQESRARM